MLLSSDLVLRGDEVVHDRRDEEEDADDEERGAGQGLSQVAEQDAEPGEVGVGERGGGEAEAREDRHADGRQEGDEQAVDEGARDAALHAALGVAEDTSGGAAEEVRDNAGENQGNGSEVGVDGRQDDQADNASGEGDQEADDDRVRSVGVRNRAVDGGDGAGDELLGDALEGRDDLADDQTDAGEDDVDAASEGAARGEGPDDPVGLGLGADVEQLVEVGELRRVSGEDATGNGNAGRRSS